MEKFKDFDEFFKELKEETIQIKLYDKVYDLPAEIPASLMLEVFRMYKTGTETVDDSKQLDIAMNMLGEANVQEWCDKGMSMKKLGKIMEWAAQQHVENKQENGTRGKK